MKDESETSLEIGRWAKYAMKQVHLALDSHSSSYFQTDIFLTIQYIGSSPTLQSLQLQEYDWCTVWNMDMIAGYK